jgi:hypothetical protein
LVKPSLLIFGTIPALPSPISLTFYSAKVPINCAISEGGQLTIVRRALAQRGRNRSGFRSSFSYGAHPVWRWLPVASFGVVQQIAHARPAAINLFQQARQFVVLVFVPFGGNVAPGIVEHAFRNALFKTLEPEPEGLYAGDVFVYAIDS